MPEHQVVVVFDLTAPTREQAARALCSALSREGLLGELRYRVQDDADIVLESWWFPEADLKVIDGNDNSPMHLEHDDEPTSFAVDAPDPTNDCAGGCGAEDVSTGYRFICTWEPGHSGQHVAGTGAHVAQVWS